MLNRLQFEVEFPTGLSIKRDLTFAQGSTAISGKNGTGKSLILEMVCYALFGQEATRGAAEDYKKCSVTLDLTIKGVGYQLHRKNGSTATLTVGDKVTCTGTRPVNQKVVEILGYGLNVFSVANLIGQGQIEALAIMKPAERKKLVDTTIGLDAVDSVITWTTNEAALSRKEADTLSSMLVEPEKPVEPVGYRVSDELKAEIETGTAFKAEADQLRGWLSSVQTAPVEPLRPAVSGTMEELTAAVRDFETATNELVTMKRMLDAIPVARYTAAEVEGLQAELTSATLWAAYDAAMKKMPSKPTVITTREEIAALRALWAVYEAFEDHKVTCPSCDHEFAPSASVMPSIDRRTIEIQESLIVAWEMAPVEPNVPRPTVKIDFTLKDVNAWAMAAARADERLALLAKITAHIIPVNRVGDLHALQHFASQEVTYLRDKHRYDQWVEEKAVKEQRLACVSVVSAADLEDLAARYHDAVMYERGARRYDTLLEAYQDALARVGAVTHRAEQMKLSGAALKDLKAKVKAFLVPSLNRVSSHLIRQMTEGQHQELSTITVTEDFEISVDGQNLETLNGSGKTVANLAVRIALGQILTNKVFSCLMADEVDAACDDERAEAIAACLKNLTPNVSQVISVSHKGIQADHYVAL